MTVPASIPKYRNPTPSERFLCGTRSTQLIKSDDGSLRRNAEAIVHQTSGEVGQHYFGIQSPALRMKMQPPPRPSYEQAAVAVPAPEAVPQSASPWSSRAPSARSEQCTPRSQRSPLQQQQQQAWDRDSAIPSAREVFRSTLHSLDPAFTTRARADLFAASQPRRPAGGQLQVQGATANYQEFQNSKAWMGRLRE